MERGAVIAANSQQGLADGRGPARAEEDRGRGQGTSGSRQIVFFFLVVWEWWLFWIAVLEDEHRREQQSSGETSEDGGPHPDPTTGRGARQPSGKPRSDAEIELGRRSNRERGRGYSTRKYDPNRKRVVHE